ncbi:c-type cytochrome biogenesis protein CcmI [Pseudoalteromonas tunicata]|uniref:Putative cytochrome c-type biogenesis protein n=1 Tax=Pseudoalteromonas tunicata D2 TaxID=87626 RepID=A4C696_9GAMM|nr:c-type cytochrome biogenesis protein CcmI [Pseudoalteromonas tunicata]ATC95475.1 hypothetical protein PTUN_a3088 [Pseudoalteromonas tunicata]AXT31049.1 c-type cytochrome biogenesis protein CcmI [Pseudoalteromonas tunicata]EAR29500.1 putative cytochrome c-type biogenesis protein [Pseudoalteromonas tunicata D2]MDP4982570.1 c-type cytochrome biogenesis protein CcmI [Pseudoalteromonas tunicata]MDP5212404.1 c-type cytochrome biogenesis protein CcmI [Pseudoalteromonas tunicata]
MTEFYIYAVILVILGCGFVVLPFIREDKLASVDPGNNAERIDIYQQRLAELNQEQQYNTLTPQAYEQAIIELKKRLLNELAPEKQFNLKGNNRVLSLVGILFMFSFSGIFYYAIGSHQQVQSWHQAIERLPELGQRAVMQTGEPLTPNELQQFALGLRTKLATNGDDQIAWMLLGRVAMSLNDFTMGLHAFEKSLSLQPDNNTVMLSFSQALLVEGSENSMNKAAKLLAKVLQKEPTNIDAISLLALIAYEKEDWLEAKAAFELLLASMTTDDPRYAMMQSRISEIESHLQTTVNKNSQTNPLQAPSLNVKIQLDSSLIGQVPANGTLFVFAKALSGPQMPLAVVKLQQFDLPQVIELSEKNAMMPSLTLANFQQVIITARISLDDKVDLASGELQGVSGTIDLSQTNSLDLTINQVIQ